MDRQPGPSTRPTTSRGRIIHRPTTRSSRRAFAVFDVAFQPWMRRHLQAVHCAVSGPLDPGPVVLAANHVSWWDGFLVRRAFQEIRPRAPLFTVMLEQELASRRWLRWLGATGVEPGSIASVRGLLRELEELAKDHPDAGFSYFPQGSIWPSARRPLGFQRGVTRVARSVGAASITPVSIHLEPGNHPTPTAWVATGAPVAPGADVEAAVERSLDLTLAFLAKYGEQADSHVAEWSALHGTSTHNGTGTT